MQQRWTPERRARGRRFIDAGGIEITIGLLWMAASLLAFNVGHFSLRYLVVDMLGFAGLVVGTRRVRFGLVVVALTLLLALALPSEQHGYIGVFAFVLVITLVRKREAWAALALTVVTLVLGSYLSYRAHPETSLPEAIAAWFFAVMITWVLALGSRAQAELSVVRERERHNRERMDFAWDLHDFVARDLTIISMRADAAIAKGGADSDELRLMAEHSRAANKFLRETAKQFGESGLPSEHKAVTIAGAFEAGKQTLEAAGRRLEHDDPCPPYPRMVDAVGGRILLEALHNAEKHGTGAVRVECTEVDDQLVIEVCNVIAKRTPRTGSGMGLEAMRQRARMFCGSLETASDGNRWVSTIRLPMEERPVRGS